MALAEEVVAHEFPSWHLFAAFEVFQLSENSTKVASRSSDADVLRNLERLAQAFQVPKDALKQEFTQLQPTAAALKKTAKLSNREAWRQAFLRVGERRRKEKTPPSALFHVLAGYMAWTASSSGVEQLFSTLKNSPTEQCKSTGSSALETDRRIAVIMGDTQVRKGPAKDIAEKARVIYCSLLRSGMARVRKQLRLDKGRPGQVRTSSHAAWNRKRKEELTNALDQLTTPPRKASAVMSTDSTQKEQNFQQKKSLKRKAEALRDGLLLQDEICVQVQNEANKMAKATQQSDQQRKKKRTQYTEQATMAVKKQDMAWACKDLPTKAWVDPQVGAEKAALKIQLRNMGVRTFVEDFGLVVFLTMFNLIRRICILCLAGLPGRRASRGERF